MARGKPGLFDLGIEWIAFNEKLDNQEGVLTLEDEQTLNAICEATADSLDRAGAVLRRFDADTALLADEIARLQARKKAIATQTEAIRGRMLFCVQQMGGKVKTLQNTFFVQAGKESVQLAVGHPIPKECERVEVTLDKVRAKALIDADPQRAKDLGLELVVGDPFLGRR